MHPLHDYLGEQLDKALRQDRVVVFYDARSEFVPFIAALEVVDSGRDDLPRVTVGDTLAHLARFEGSFFALKARIEPLVTVDKPDPLLVYIPGQVRDRTGSVLMEIEQAGHVYGDAPGHALKSVARRLLRQTYTDGDIDVMLQPELLSYQDVARFLGQGDDGGGSFAAALRTDHGTCYTALANAVEQEFGLATATIDPASLGSIDTFRFEERSLLHHTAKLITQRDYAEALALVTGRARSFWVDQPAFLDRLAQWELCRLLSELGAVIETVRSALNKMPTTATAWIDAYAQAGGWFEVDRAQRALETWVAAMADDPEEALEQALAVTKRQHEALLKEMATGFIKALMASARTTPGCCSRPTSTRSWSSLARSGWPIFRSMPCVGRRPRSARSWVTRRWSWFARKRSTPLASPGMNWLRVR